MRIILLSALRVLYKDKTYAYVSLLSLSIGIACIMVLGLYAKSEFSYDQHYSNSERIYRVAGSRIAADGNVYLSAPVSPLLGPYLNSNFPEVEAFVRFDSAGGGLIEVDGVSYFWDRDTTFITDRNVFEVFDHEIVAGDPHTALLRPATMAVSESFARQYFGHTDILGKTVTRRGVDYTINLVFADHPPNTHFKYDILMSADDSLEATRRRAGGERLQGIWLGSENPAYTYVLMPENYEPELFAQVSDVIWDSFLGPLLARSGFTQHFFLESLESIHFTSRTEADFPRGNSFYPLAMLIIGVFVLLVAAINYVILATARATKRQRSLAFQKLLGAQSGHLIVGFIAESVLFCLLAFVMGYFLAETSLNQLFSNGFLNSPARNEALLDYSSLVLALGLVLLLGLLAAVYPAKYLSGISIQSAFKLGVHSRVKGNLNRKLLVALQFVISISFVSCSAFMYLQMRYVAERPLGFEIEDKLTMQVYRSENIERLPAFVEAIKEYPSVLNATVSREIPGEVIFSNQTRVEDRFFADQTLGLYRAFIDENYIDTFGMNVVEGRNLNSGLRTGDNYALVNETLVRTMEWENPLDMRVQGLQVLGVVEDFHFQGLQQAVAPLYMQYHMNYQDYGSESQREGQIRTLTISTTGDQPVETLQTIRRAWESFFPELAFEYRYLDDAIAEIYGNDQQQMLLVIVLTVLCVFIACIGQYSMTAIAIEQRTKEIGIRRTFGATSLEIILLFFRSNGALLLVAGTVSTILSYLAATEWLDTYAYRVDIELFVFLLSALLVGMLALFTTTLQLLKITRGNAWLALRYE